jgi:hypothetical protein
MRICVILNRTMVTYQVMEFLKIVFSRINKNYKILDFFGDFILFHPA